MASIIRIKRSEVAGNPTTLAAGELAYSALADTGGNGGDRLYIGIGTETSGNAANHVVIGGKYFTDQITAATALNTSSTLVKRDSSGNFAAGTITAALSGNASTATKWATGRNLSLTGDGTATLTSVDGSAAVSAALTLATVNSNIGSFGSSTAIPIVTVNAKGLVTSVSTATISTSLSIAGSTGSGSVALGTDTFTIAGGTGVTSSYNNTTKTTTLSIGQAVGTTDSVTFNSVTVNGSLNSDDITAANISVAGNATITGNLTVQGTTTTINSTTVAVSDLNIVVAKDAANATAANGAGLTVNGPTTAATLTYTSVDDRWNLNKNLNVTTVFGALSGNATTATTLATPRAINGVNFDGSAAITVTAAAGTLTGSSLAAGVIASSLTSVGTIATGVWNATAITDTYLATISTAGKVSNTATTATAFNTGNAIVTRDASGNFIAGVISADLTGNASTATKWATARNLSLTGDASATLSNVDGSGAVSAALTLATVNSNVGSFGTSTTVPSITVNAKGLVTAVTTNSIPTATSSVLGLASFNSTDFTVSSGAVSITTVDGGTY
jgi:hypothetical protein